MAAFRFPAAVCVLFQSQNFFKQKDGTANFDFADRSLLIKDRLSHYLGTFLQKIESVPVFPLITIISDVDSLPPFSSSER